MTSLRLQPFSLLAGACVALLAFVAMGQKNVPQTLAQVHGSSTMNVVRPKDFVSFKGDETYVVPSDRTLILTTVSNEGGLAAPPVSAQLRVDGVPVFWTEWEYLGRFYRLPGAHIFAAGGSTVEWYQGNPTFAFASGITFWGYLVNDAASGKKRVMLVENVPYTVPSGRVFVPTVTTGAREVLDLVPWGSRSGEAPRLLVDGIQVIRDGLGHFVFPRSGVSFPSGSVIEVQGMQWDEARLWGYTVDE
jgi:hypothetical protein